jgi:predicted Zn-dependent protease
VAETYLQKLAQLQEGEPLMMWNLA